MGQTPSTGGRRLRATIGLLACIASCPAQPEADQLVAFTTEDGSRFLLVVGETTPVVHWVTFTPAGVLEDPPGLEGLSFAVARAALTGTRTLGSRDPVREQTALGKLDELEAQIAGITSRDETVTAEIAAAYLAARTGAAELAQPLAWERELRAAPSLGARLRQLPDGMLLHVTTTVSGLGKVAALLYDRREHAVLRGVHDELRTVREELANERAATAAARGELLTLSYLGHPYSRAHIDTRRPVILGRATAQGVFARTNHPARSFHVLTGGFDPERVRSLLQAVFRTTRLEREPRVIPSVPPLQTARRSTIRGALHPSLTLGYRIGRRDDRATLAVLIEWLAGGDDSELATRLRLAGHPNVVMRADAPFPGSAAEALVLIELESPSDEDGFTAQSLLADFDAALAAAVAEGPAAGSLSSAAARVGTRHRAHWLGPQELAYTLAIRCGLDGARPEEALAPPEIPSADAVLELARALFVEERRAIVLQEPAR